MILIGQYGSPFVRRVAMALGLYGIRYEHRPWSTFGDAGCIAPFNPLRRVPTLVLDSGEALIESGAILDYLDELVGSSRRLRQSSISGNHIALLPPDQMPRCGEQCMIGDSEWRGKHMRTRTRDQDPRLSGNSGESGELEGRSGEIGDRRRRRSRANSGRGVGIAAEPIRHFANA